MNTPVGHLDPTGCKRSITPVCAASGRPETPEPSAWSDFLDSVASRSALSLHDPRARHWPTHISGKMLLDRCSLWTGELGRSGAPANSLVLIPMHSSIDGIALLIAACEARWLPILVNPTTPPQMLIDLARQIGVSLVVSVPAAIPCYESQGFTHEMAVGHYRVMRSPFTAAPCLADTRQLIGLCSSGSTGRPKIVVHYLDRLVLNARLHADSIGLDEHDTVALTLPFHFSAGLVAGLFSTLIRARQGLLLDVRKINAKRHLAEHPATVCMSTPATVLDMFDEQSLRRARILTVGGDALPGNMARKILDRQPSNLAVYSTYGLTEAGPRVATSLVLRSDIDHYGAVPLGRPLAGVHLRLGDIHPQTGAGELLIETPTLMRGYLHDTEMTSAAIDPRQNTVRSKDLFRRVDDVLLFAGRLDRVIVRGGESIHPACVEAVLRNHLGLDDVWVSAEPHPTLGQIPVAFVVGGPPTSDAAYRKKLRTHLPASHIPAVWHRVDEVPPCARK